MTSEETRFEHDSMGKVAIPAWALWGAQTQRASENFPISGIRFSRRFIRALGLIKQSAAEINRDLELLDAQLAEWIITAASEVVAGQHDEHFIVDIYQTGSGTSTNMNANEVIANRAILLAGGQVGQREPVHPNDHVNLGQSSNDVIPTAIHVAAAEACKEQLIPALFHFQEILESKAKAFDHVFRIGRTHLQDATPVRLGQTFSGFAAQVALCQQQAEALIDSLSELAIGGTAVGTGLNTHPAFGRGVTERLAQHVGIGFREATNHFALQGSKDAACQASAQLRHIAVALTKIANDIRWLGSGPRCGLGEISLPAIQPGSSIMPGKVNPVMSEMLIQVCAQVIGYDTAVMIAARDSIFELNVMMPLIAHNLLTSIDLLTKGIAAFADKCVTGIEADEQRCKEMIEQSLAMCTALAPVIGYDRAAELAKQAYSSGRTIREVATEAQVLPENELDRLLDPASMTRPKQNG